MSRVMDRRIAARRRTVTEAGARRRMRWLLALLATAAGAGLGGWLVFQSPYLAVSEVAIDGVDHSEAVSIVARHGVEPGLATIRVRPGALESALVGDPWIAAAEVRVTWPGTVDIVVFEHAPSGWVQAGDRWHLTSAGGVVLETGLLPGSGVPRVEVGTVPTPAGETVDAAARAALEFVTALPARLAETAVVTGGMEGLSARIQDHRVLLGYPTDMAVKAAAYAALVEAGIPPGADVNVVAPDRPAVFKPQVETSLKVLGSGSTSG